MVDEALQKGYEDEDQEQPLTEKEFKKIFASNRFSKQANASVDPDKIHALAAS